MSKGNIAKLQKKHPINYKNSKKICTINFQNYITAIMINTKRACLRFYGNEKMAYYIAHNHKDEEGIKKKIIYFK